MSYTGDFFKNQKGGSLASAEVMVPLVLELVPARSVVDVGCGVGTWLSIFEKHGLSIFGIDGPWVDTEQLLIPQSAMRTVDLEKPWDIDTQADLAMSLEVAEHLSSDKAEGFISSLTALAPVILFSAAIPHQGGVHHVNEQWPEYWAELFKARGYVPVDCIRRKVWNDDRVAFWYAQNTFIYVKESALASYPKLAAAVAGGHGAALSLIHPKKYLYFAERWQAVVPILGKIPPSLLRRGKRFLALFRAR